jgi:hypothetical protein
MNVRDALRQMNPGRLIFVADSVNATLQKFVKK